MNNNELPVDLTVAKRKEKNPLFRPYEETETSKSVVCKFSGTTESSPSRDADQRKSADKNDDSPASSLATTCAPNLATRQVHHQFAPGGFYTPYQFLFPYQWYQRRLSRPLCGKYVRSGPAASRLTLLLLRQQILQRQQMKFFLHALSSTNSNDQQKHPTISNKRNFQPKFETSIDL